MKQPAYYDSQVPNLGERFAGDLRQATELLLQHPEIGSQADAVLRKFPLSKFPFTLYYSSTSEIVLVVAVAHQRRLPGYWKSRIDR